MLTNTYVMTFRMMLEDSVSLFQYDDGIHPGYIDGATAGGIYEPHVAHRPSLSSLHHSPHMNHPMHTYHHNHVNPAANHVMGATVPDVGKRDKDAIYG